MAKATHRKTAHPVNSFIRCFGLHRKKSFDGGDKPDHHLPADHTKNPRKRSSCFHWSMSRINKSPVRTVPLDHSAQLISTTDSAKTPRSSNSKFQQIRLARDSPNSSLGCGTTSNRRHLENSKFETCSKKRISFCRKADAIQPGSGQPGNPPHVKLPKPQTQEMISRPPAQSRVGSKVMIRELKGKHETATLGMSIVIVTLVIMLFWGRLCAILCTSAWFYFSPRLTTLINHNHDDDDDDDGGKISGKPPSSSAAALDFNSAEHKKRVVFEGFLNRN